MGEEKTHLDRRKPQLGFKPEISQCLTVTFMFDCLEHECISRMSGHVHDVWCWWGWGSSVLCFFWWVWRGLNNLEKNFKIILKCFLACLTSLSVNFTVRCITSSSWWLSVTVLTADVFSSSRHIFVSPCFRWALLIFCHKSWKRLTLYLSYHWQLAVQRCSAILWIPFLLMLIPLY